MTLGYVYKTLLWSTEQEKMKLWRECLWVQMCGSGWEPINTNIPESIGVGSQYWGVSIGIGGVLNKRIDQV